jgi:hypothetical protein
MPFALSLKSVNATADAIMSLWDQVSAFEDFPSMRALTYPPHITFAIYDSPTVSEQLAIATLEKAARGRAAIELCFDRIRTFGGPPLILWPIPNPRQHCAKSTIRFMPRSIPRFATGTTGREAGCRIARWPCALGRIGIRMHWRLSAPSAKVSVSCST